MSMNDDENNHFPIRSIVVKGEYLTQDDNARKKGGYVYRFKIDVYQFSHVFRDGQGNIKGKKMV